MPEVQVYERATPSFAATLANRGHHIVYRANSDNHCPGCGRSHWHIGRIMAECAFCGTALPLEGSQGIGGSQIVRTVRRRLIPDPQHQHAA